ncbi:hypothetical protein [Thermostaphylospora chromogena]|uniref:Secreted protein n=1 Tax=Thermostaphylospora chromogena TaxID=35622 RepID=A0A1H1E7T6_9ACTN|nr:hypothetical protein [Thermostaphylospora chromogena]SDQ84630.1 hypothetical protein SAMN04489764_2348 [Thermostaphylospora chromogena]
MLKKLVLAGVAAAFTGMVAAPAQAAPWNENEFNVSEQSGNVIVCGNSAIGDILIPLIPLQPVTTADRDTVDCGVRVQQDQD